MSRRHDKNKTKEQLIKELVELRQQIAELEQGKNERSQETEERSEEYLQEIIDGVKDGIVILDLTGTVTTINKRVTEVAEYTEKEIIGKRLTRLKMFPPKSIATMFTAFTHVVSGQQPPPYEVEVYTKTGKKLVVEIHGSLLRKGGKKAGVIAVLRDVTERKQLEALLLRERETFVTILQHALYGVALLDKEGKHLYVNPTFTAITGYTLEDIHTGEDWLHKAYPDEAYRKKITGLWKKDRGLGGTSREISVVCKNRETKEIEFNSTVLDDGRAVVMLSDITERKRAEEALQRHQENLEVLVTERTAALQATNAQLQQEITERKEAEEKLKESEERFRNVFEMAQDLIYIKDCDLKFTAVNPAMERYFGVSASEIIGKKTTALLGRKVGLRSREEDGRVLNGEIIDTEHSFQVQGNTVIQNVVKVPMRNSAGEIIGLCGTARDITARAKAEEALQDSEERLKILFEFAPDGYYVNDLKGIFIDGNRAAEEITGYKREELIGKNFLKLKLLPKNQIPRAAALLAQNALGKTTGPDEFTLNRKDGSQVPLEIRTYPIKIHGQTLVLGIARDITERKRAEEALRESEEKYRELINGMNDTAWVIDFDGKFIDVNDAAVEVSGYSREELLTMGPYDIDSSLDAKKITGLIKRMRKDKLQVFETTHTTKDGKTIPVEIKSSLVTYQGKQAILSVARDITERKKAEEALRESESRFRLLVEHSVDAFVLHDLDGKIMDVNQYSCDTLGYTREELLSLSVQDIDSRIVVDKHQEQWKKMVPGKPLTLEGVQRRKDGTIFPIEIRLVAFESGGRRLILSIARDITERVRAEKTIRQLAYHDALTGLPNRVLFVDRLEHAIAQAHRKQNKFAVMLLDLDHFKDINDTLGHSVGDQLLSSVGKLLIRLLRKEDTVSRMGGDEFFLLLPEINELHDATTIAQKVLNAFQEESFVLDDHDVNITTSIGVAIYPDDGEAVKTLLRNADVALYQAKQRGRDNYQHYTQEMDPDSQADE